MSKALSIKPTDRAIKTYFDEMTRLREHGTLGEGQVAPQFANLLREYGGKLDYTLVEQYSMDVSKGRIQVDGAMRHDYLTQGVWEAKDDDDDLEQEIKAKFARGYPTDNIIFQAPAHAVVIQNGVRVFDQPIDTPQQLATALETFLTYVPANIAVWQKAVDEFAERIPQYANELLELINDERTTQRNKTFIRAFEDFAELCRTSINPNISDDALVEMIIQHLLTERVFRTVFNNPDFSRRNIIAAELEKVIDALTSRFFNRADFSVKLDRFYVAIEFAAQSIADYSEKQDFLNHVYERFFQGFAVKVADTHGIVYTPQPIVDFMVRSVDDLLQREFGRRLADKGVHILDPFVGTGNFILRIMRQIAETSRAALPHKFQHELHCNEVMLLPYYIASSNIEHQYHDLVGEYAPFDGIVFGDTFELERYTLAKQKQASFDFGFNAANTERMIHQEDQDLTVIIGNPPYNVGQVNENDNNKNRQYPELDQRIADTYLTDSAATNRRQLYDPYVRAFRWASDRIGSEGVIAFVTNNSFLDALAFDGMRKHLQQDFDALYVLDLGGNVRKNPKISGTTHNVFGIQVGVVVALLVRQRERSSLGQIYYYRTDEFWRKEQKYELLASARDYHGVAWQEITPNARHTWLTDGLQNDFETFLPMGSKDAKAGRAEGIIFTLYSRGAETTRDTWAYSFGYRQLAKNMQIMIETYNTEVYRWRSVPNRTESLDNFVVTDETRIKWSSSLKQSLVRGDTATYDAANVRASLYRPFTKQHLYFDSIMTHRRGVFPEFLPTPEQEAENRVICVSGVGSLKPFHALMVVLIPSLDILEKTQCFPFYVYDEDGTNRRENITDWALEHYQTHYSDPAISKWDIFHYIYALLHHPVYREKYAANLKRMLPHIPFAPDFWAFVTAGRELAAIHVEYEQQPEYAELRWIESQDEQVRPHYRVEKMRLSKDKSTLHYNDFWRVEGIPLAAYDYKLGNRSALEWVVDRYRVKTDKRSGIVNDPNEYSDDERYIMRLIGQVITVSLRTVEIVNGLPPIADEAG